MGDVCYLGKLLDIRFGYQPLMDTAAMLVGFEADDRITNEAALFV